MSVFVIFSHLLDAINFSCKHTSIMKTCRSHTVSPAVVLKGTSYLWTSNFSCPITVWQFSWRVRFDFGLGTFYCIYLYISCVLLAPFFIFVLTQTVEVCLKRADWWRKCIMSNQCLSRESRKRVGMCLWLYFYHFFLRFSLESGCFTPRSILTAQSKPEHWCWFPVKCDL